ncbi:thiol:disulfide interchange protein TlpA [Phreatobacter stygius]|uniref:thiol:disulfide interchange protein TlpA n=1 Tax=Phreatobacter stygius TaxID=1940610 RepID=UPI001FEA344A|nr:TlpA disulfide reductase family protein [Phreatobacter stygius]
MSRAKVIILLAGLIGLGAGFGAFYWTGGLSGNAGVQACSAAQPVSARLSPFARGEVAAFKVTERPQPSPNLVFKAADGRELKLSDFRGRTVLLNLWATWCVPCRHEMPALDKLQATLGGANFEVVAVNIDTRHPDKARAWLREAGIRHLADYSDHSAKIFQELRSVGRAFGMPTTLLIDPQGCELGHLPGPAEWASDDALNLIRAAITP